MTPEQIHQEWNKLTDEQVGSLTEVLNTMLPAHKQLWSAQDEGSPHQATKVLLMNALDWFQYGN
jgi:hypothetical protein